MSSKVVSQENKHNFLSILSGTLVAIAMTLVLILLFALFIRFFDISDGWIFPINQIIKVISMIVGSILLFKKNKQKGLLKGLLLGLVYFILSYIIFSILQGSFAWNISNFYDLLLTTLMCGIIGIIVVNIGKR